MAEAPRLRIATLGNFHDLRALEVACIPADELAPEDYIRVRIEHGKWKVTFLDYAERAVAFSILEPNYFMRTPGTITIVPMLQELGVHPDFRGREFGPALVRNAIAETVDRGCLFVTVLNTNVAAQKTYAKCGFEFWRAAGDDRHFMLYRHKPKDARAVTEH